MNIFSILSESRNPSTNTGKTYSDLVHNRQMRIVVEAEDDENDETPEPEANDEDTTDDKENESKEEIEEKDEDSNKDEPDEPEDDDNDEPEDNSDDEMEPPDLDVDSNNSDDNTGSDDSISDTSATEGAPKDEIDPDKTKAHALLDDAITLYYSIKRIIDKLDNVSAESFEVIQSFIKAKDNFINLSDLLFDFITQRFTTNTYVKNLYIFNYFIQTYKLNVEILEKTLKSQSE